MKQKCTCGYPKGHADHCPAAVTPEQHATEPEEGGSVPLCNNPDCEDGMIAVYGSNFVGGESKTPCDECNAEPEEPCAECWGSGECPHKDTKYEGDGFWWCRSCGQRSTDSDPGWTVPCPACRPEGEGGGPMLERLIRGGCHFLTRRHWPCWRVYLGGGLWSCDKCGHGQLRGMRWIR